MGGGGGGGGVRIKNGTADKRRGEKPVVLIHKLHNNDFDKSVNKKNISWPEYFSFYKATIYATKH